MVHACVALTPHAWRRDGQDVSISERIWKKGKSAYWCIDRSPEKVAPPVALRWAKFVMLRCLDALHEWASLSREWRSERVCVH